jgi:hypothetical protein
MAGKKKSGSGTSFTEPDDVGTLFPPCILNLDMLIFSLLEYVPPTSETEELTGKGKRNDKRKYSETSSQPTTSTPQPSRKTDSAIAV